MLTGGANGTPSGRIEIICGCMFSGKTARLIERLQAAQTAGKAVLAFKHVLDTRYTPTALATHDGRRFPACAVEDAELIDARSEAAEVIGIDEGQFFGRKLVAVCERLRAGGSLVIVAGIDYDTWGRPFPPFPQLKEAAADVEIMTVPCRLCGQPARLSQRITPVVNGQMVGGPEAYEPRCAKCFVPYDAPAPAY